jgi:2-iminobutanoate/2-iminopropanoate deaminase
MPEHPLQEIFGPASLGPAPAGVRSGDTIYCGHINGADPATGEVPEALEEQLTNAFATMRALVERAGASIDNIARVSLFLRQLSDLKSVNGHWVAMFPDASDRPTYKFLQVDLPSGRHIELDFFAVAGGRRTLLAIEGVAHTNPIPLAVKIGSMLFSSRILPSDVEKGQYGETPERQAELSFRHARQLVEMAGGAPSNISQIRAFIKEPVSRAAIDHEVRRMFPDGAAPPVEILHYPSAGPLQAMIEIDASRLPQ